MLLARKGREEGGEGGPGKKVVERATSIGLTSVFLPSLGFFGFLQV